MSNFANLTKHFMHFYRLNEYQDVRKLFYKLNNIIVTVDTL